MNVGSRPRTPVRSADRTVAPPHRCNENWSWEFDDRKTNSAHSCTQSAPPETVERRINPHQPRRRVRRRRADFHGLKAAHSLSGTGTKCSRVPGDAFPNERYAKSLGEISWPYTSPCRAVRKRLMPNSRPAGPVNPSELASLTVRVRSTGDPKALEKRVYEQAAKPLAKREYLTHEQLAEQYGGSKEDLDKVEAFAQQHDLFVVRRSAPARTIELRGKLADLLRGVSRRCRHVSPLDGNLSRATRRNRGAAGAAAHHHRRVWIRYTT